MEQITISKTFLELIILILSLLGMTWRMSRTHTKLLSDINAVGGRTTTAQETATAAKVLAETAERRASESGQELGEVGRRVAKVEGALDAMKDEMATNRLEFVTMLHNNDKASSERDSKIRESIARIASKLDVPEDDV
jgi:hypothetical protein